MNWNVIKIYAYCNVVCLVSFAVVLLLFDPAFYQVPLGPYAAFLRGLIWWVWGAGPPPV